MSSEVQDLCDVRHSLYNAETLGRYYCIYMYIPYCDYLIRVLFNANFAKTRKIALLNMRNNNVFTT